MIQAELCSKLKISSAHVAVYFTLLIFPVFSGLDRNYTFAMSFKINEKEMNERNASKWH